MTRPAPAAATTRVEGVAGSYVRPTDLAEVLALLQQHPDAVLVAGSTDWGVDVNLRGARTPLVIGIDRLEELRALTRGPAHLELGAALTLAELERGLAGSVPLLDAVFPQFASPLIRNGGDHRRQPRHRLPHRRPRPGPPRARGLGRPPRSGR